VPLTLLCLMKIRHTTLAQECPTDFANSIRIRAEKGDKAK
jgi:hypothetical protein